MGKNKNKNRVKRILETKSKFVMSMIAFTDDDLVVAKNISKSENKVNPDDVAAVFNSTYDLELTRDEMELTARVLLGTSEAQNPDSIVDLTKFMDGLYNASLTTNGFSRVVEDLANCDRLDKFTNSHAQPIVQIVCTWILIRTLFLKLQEELETATTKPAEPVVEVVDSEIVVEAEVKNEDGDKIYVLSKRQETEADLLGLEVIGHTFNVDKFYRSETELVMDWKEKYGTYVPPYKLYGMTPKAYAEWRMSVTEFIKELMDDSEQIVASSNIGKTEEPKTDTPKKEPKRRMEKKKLDLPAMAANYGDLKKKLHENFNYAGDIIGMIKNDPTFSKYAKIAEQEYKKINPIKVETDLRLLYGAPGLDVKKAIAMAIMIASKTNADPKDVAVYTIPLFCDDTKFVAKFLMRMEEKDVKSLVNLNNVPIVAPAYLKSMVKEWIDKNAYKESQVSSEDVAKMSDEEFEDWNARSVIGISTFIHDLFAPFVEMVQPQNS